MADTRTQPLEGGRAVFVLFSTAAQLWLLLSAFSICPAAKAEDLGRDAFLMFVFHKLSYFLGRQRSRVLERWRSCPSAWDAGCPISTQQLISQLQQGQSTP